jgi:hypothetical protein
MREREREVIAILTFSSACTCKQARSSWCHVTHWYEWTSTFYSWRSIMEYSGNHCNWCTLLLFCLFFFHSSVFSLYNFVVSNSIIVEKPWRGI